MIEVLLHALERPPLHLAGSQQAPLAGSEALLRQALGAHLGLSAAGLPLRRSATGKPYLAMDDAPAFSLSHSGDWLLIALCSDHRVKALGVDVEHDRGQPRPFARLARRFFTPVEQRLLAALEGSALAAQFYRLWTLKEAWVKAHGLVLAPYLSQLCFAPPEAHTADLPAAGSAASLPGGTGTATACLPPGPLRCNSTGLADGVFSEGLLTTGVPFALCVLPQPAGAVHAIQCSRVLHSP